MRDEAGSNPRGEIPVHICTVAARNYLARVRVLARSFHRHHPDGIVDVYVVDDRFGEVDLSEEGIRVIPSSELTIDPRQLRAMALYYDVTELSTSLKPWVLEAALARSSGPVLYLDPDIEIFDSLAELSALADEHGIVLVPHLLAPMPRDGCTPTEQTILLSGIYNLGFAGVSAAARPFLSWWQERLRTDAIIDHAAGLFTDQRWIDFVPSLFNCYISRDPSYDVAYWNLHERSITRDGERFLVNGVPLRFFHYSGFDPAKPYLLSNSAGPRPRVLLSEHPLLAELCAAYADAVTAAADEWSSKPYGWRRLDNGLAIDAVVRRAYRAGLLASGWDTPESPPDLTTEGASGALVEWLAQVPTGEALPRYVRNLFEMRVDLANDFGRVPGSDAKRLAEWLRTRAGVQIGTAPRLVDRLCEVIEGVLADDETIVPSGTGEGLGVDVIGLLRTESGVGEASRRTALALRAADEPFRLLAWNRTVPGRSRAGVDAPGRMPAETDIAVVHINADVFSHVNHDFRSHLADRYRIGVWFWEVSTFPDFVDRPFELVDEVWTASRFARDAIAARAPVPVLWMPLPLVTPPVDESMTRQDVGMRGDGDEFVFLNVFDFLSVVERKNPLGLIEAYTRAFGPGDGARLIIKTINGVQRIAELEQVRMAASHRPDVEIRDGYLDATGLGTLVALADAYISLHRSEGLGLTLADAMMLGKPTIATAYSGNTDFMTPENSYLVPFTMREVGEGNLPYDPRALWAQPDPDEAAAMMREVFENRAEARRRGAQAQDDLTAQFSPLACGERMVERFASIRRERRGDA